MRSFLPQPGLKPFGPKLGPRLLYPVWVKDGRQELVRGASFGERETRARCGDRVVASFLFDKLELELSPIKQEKLPEYPVPPLSQDWEARWFVLIPPPARLALRIDHASDPIGSCHLLLFPAPAPTSPPPVMALLYLQSCPLGSFHLLPAAPQ